MMDDRELANRLDALDAKITEMLEILTEEEERLMEEEGLENDREKERTTRQKDFEE